MLHPLPSLYFVVNFQIRAVHIDFRMKLTILFLLQSFCGAQNVSSLQKDEAWKVNVRIQGCDIEHGFLCGTMEALNVPLADTPVQIFYQFYKVLVIIIVFQNI